VDFDATRSAHGEPLESISGSRTWRRSDWQRHGNRDGCNLAGVCRMREAGTLPETGNSLSGSKKMQPARLGEMRTWSRRATFVSAGTRATVMLVVPRRSRADFRAELFDDFDAGIEV